MKKWPSILPAVVAAMGLFLANLALGQSVSAPKTTGKDVAPQPAESAPRGSVSSKPLGDEAATTRKASFPKEEEEPEDSPFREEPAVAPTPDEAYDSRGELPPAPKLPPALDLSPLSEKAGNAWVDDASGSGCDRCGPSCRGRTHGACGRGSCPPCGSCRRGLGGITIGGWLDQGITVNGRLVADRFNGPVTFNDRDGEYQMNQLWLFAEKEVDTGGYGLGIGGRVDVVYGTDWRFTTAEGLEETWNESERFYGLALPQVYLDVAVNNLTVRMGHYYTIIGYEVVTAPDNFFYSHSYTLQYGEPFTHTGLLASYALSDQVAISGGFDRGWNTWEDNNHDQSFLGGVSWTSCDESTSLACAVTTGPYDDAGQLNRTMYSVVFSRQVTDRLRYVLQHDYGIDNDGGFLTESGTIPDAEWYGINQYLLYDINPCWSLGVRTEWFRDDDGVRVGGIGPPHGWTLGPDRAANQPGWAGDFSAVTFGVNWKPTDRIIVRPEWRWDWYSGPADGLGRLPYDAGTRRSQFTFGTDVILTF